jgi:MFS family permease
MGCFLLVFGLMILSLSREYYQIFLFQGVCVGLGSGVVYVPCTSIVANLFKKKRPLAMSAMLTGVSIGGVLYPIIFRRLQLTIGFPWIIRVMGFISLGVSLIALPTLWRLPKKTTKPRKLFEWHAFKEPAFV